MAKPRDPLSLLRQNATKARNIPKAKIDLCAVFLLQVKASREIPPPVKEYVFHQDRDWRFDAAWVDQKIAVEIQGGISSGGRHVRPEGYTNDCEKLAEAVLLGWRVFFATSKQVMSGQALRWVERLFAKERGQSQEKAPVSPQDRAALFREARERLVISREELARRSGVSALTIARLESEEPYRFRITTLRKVMRSLKMKEEMRSGELSGFIARKGTL